MPRSNPPPGTDDQVYDALLKPHDHMTCRRREDLLGAFTMGTIRVAAIICIAEHGWTIVAGKPAYPVMGRAHGYDNDDPDMRALFIAYGSGLRGDVGLVGNIEVYPLLMRLIRRQAAAERCAARCSKSCATTLTCETRSEPRAPAMPDQSRNTAIARIDNSGALTIWTR